MNQKEQENKKYQDWLDEHPEERTLEEQILIDGGIHEEINGWISQEDAIKWAEEQLKINPISQDVLDKRFQDQLLYKESKYHVSDTGVVSNVPIFGDIEKSIQQSYDQYINDPGNAIIQRMLNEKESTAGEVWTSKYLGADVVMTLADGSKQIHKLPESTPATTYNSLEEILGDMIQQKRHLTIMSKLQNTINAGKYIQQDGRE